MKTRILILAILMFSFLIPQAKAKTGGFEPIDESSPVIQAVRARLKAYQDNDLKALSQGQPKLLQEVIREIQAQPPDKKRNALIGSAQLKGMRFITSDRAWIDASIPEQPWFKGFYFIKEDGVWKDARLKLYILKAEQDLDSIAKAIGDYYKDNKKLPQTLNELLTPRPYMSVIPVDPFSDNGAPYVYKVINENNCRIYSIGPDSEDDGGEKVYEPKFGLPTITDGDIIKEYSG